MQYLLHTVYPRLRYRVSANQILSDSCFLAYQFNEVALKLDFKLDCCVYHRMSTVGI